MEEGKEKKKRGGQDRPAAAFRGVRSSMLDFAMLSVAREYFTVTCAACAVRWQRALRATA